MLHESKHWRSLLANLLVCIVYVIVCKVALLLASVHSNAAPVWPGTGLALASVLLFGFRLWPGILAASFLVNLATGGNWLTSVGIAFGNTAEALLAAWCIERFGDGFRALDRSRSAVLFVVFAGLLGPFVSATIGVSCLAMAGYAPWDRFGIIWLTWWTGNSLSGLILAPFLVTWATRFLSASDPYRFHHRTIISTLFGVALLLVSAVALGSRFSGGFDLNSTLLVLQAVLAMAAVGALVLCGAVSERKHAENQLHFQRALLLAQSEASIDGFLVVSTSGQIISYNRRFGEMWGIPSDILRSGSDEAALKSVSDKLANSAEFYERVRYLYENPDERSQDEVQLKDGRVFDRYSAPVRDKSGTYYGRIWQFRDISARKQAELDVQQLNQTLEKRVRERTAALEETKDQMEAFCYSISHDLRAPLRAMQGFTTALLEDYGNALDTTGREYARRIVDASKRMDLLIQDLLEYSRITRVDLKMTPVNLAAVLSGVGSQLESEINEKRARLSVPKATGEVLAHEGVLERVLVNLVSNSLKFVADGVAPEVRVIVEDLGDNIRVRVQDNGIGIEVAHQDRIFGVFERLHQAQMYPGTGIGLAIVRKGIERMGGRVGVESEAGKGSCFWFTLPKPR